MSQTPNSDDDYGEVVVTPNAPAPARKPRAENPAVDNVIQSGEIAPRSLIIRSASLPALTRDDPTEPAERRHAPPIVITRTRKVPPIVWLIAAAAPLIAALVLHNARPATTPPVAASTHSPEAESLAELAGTLFDGDARAAQARADAIASSSMLRAGIQTDAKTLEDMARDKDVVFPLGAGESLQIFQGAGTSRTSLLRLPSAGPVIAPPSTGTARLEASGGNVDVVVAASVAGASSQLGEIALVTPIDLGSLRGRPAGNLTNIALTGLGAPISLGGGPAAAAGSQITIPISTTIAKGTTLAIAATIAAAPQIKNTSGDTLAKAAYACAALAVLFLIMFAVSMFRR